MIISVTERAAFKRCRRAWSYSHQQHLSKLVAGTNLLLGTLIHKAHEAWLNEPEKQLAELFLVVVNKELVIIRDNFFKARGVHADDENDLSSVLDQVELGTKMCINYQKYWKTPIPENLKLLTTEQRLTIEIPGTNGEHHLEAKLDALLVNRHGKIYVLEHKTYSQKPNLETLDTNDQFTAYTWAATQMGIGEVAGIAYDGMMKKREAHDLSTLFFRTPIHRSKHELKEFEEELAQEAYDMANNPHIYKFRRWEGCWDCSYERLCRAQSRGEDTDYILKSYYTREDHD